MECSALISRGEKSCENILKKDSSIFLETKTMKVYNKYGDLLGVAGFTANGLSVKNFK